MNLNQVTLPAFDIVESAKFFRRMGFTQIVDAPHYARFECPKGDTTFSIHRTDTIQKNSGFVVYFETEDLDNKIKELELAGFIFIQQPRDEPWLWREARLTDPSGNIICLYWAGINRKNPPWRVSA